MKAFRMPLLLFALPAALVAFAASGSGLWLERFALVEGGFWRLWTAHWVHFSISHLAWNLVVLLGAGAWLERARPGWLLRHTLVAAPLISVILLVAEPAMRVYGGLSALATGVVTLLALVQLHDRRADRALWIALLLVVAAKIVHDASHATALFGRFDTPGVRPSVWAHAAGAGTALALWPLWQHRTNRPQSPPENKSAGTRDGLPAARFR